MTCSTNPSPNRPVNGRFVFSSDGALIPSSGIGPNEEDHITIVAFSRGYKLQPSRVVSDPELSPLDLAVAPNSHIVASLDSRRQRLAANLFNDR